MQNSRRSGVRGIFLGTDGPTVLVRRMAGGVYVLAGELSGDAHGAGVIRALKAGRPGLVVGGAGGAGVRAAGGGGGGGGWSGDARGGWQCGARLGGGFGGGGRVGGFEAVWMVQAAVCGDAGGGAGHASAGVGADRLSWL